MILILSVLFDTPFYYNSEHSSISVISLNLITVVVIVIKTDTIIQLFLVAGGSCGSFNLILKTTQ